MPDSEAPKPADNPIAAGGTRSTGPSRGSERADSAGCCAAGTARVVAGVIGMLTAVTVLRAPLSPGISASASATITRSAIAIVLSWLSTIHLASSFV